MGKKISFTSSDTKIASEALDRLSKLYGNCAIEDADVIVALGGDGFMLQTLHRTQDLSAPVYGMNRGTVGFLMNAYCLLYTSPSPRDTERSRMPSSA